MKPSFRPSSRPQLLDKSGNPHPAIAAIKALESGLARPDQQKLALAFIIDELGRTYSISYMPDELGGERDTAFAEGRRYIGLWLRRIVLQPLSELIGTEPKPTEEPYGS